jgi:hypothetical protein
MVAVKPHHNQNRDPPPPPANVWAPLLEVFRALTHQVGDPEEASHDIRRALLSGQVHSLRRRPLNDSFEDLELNRSFWRDFELFPAQQSDGRDTIGLRPKQGMDRSAALSALEKCIFYLHRNDCLRLWSILLPNPVETSPEADAAPVSRADDKLKKSRFRGDVFKPYLRRRYGTEDKIPDDVNAPTAYQKITKDMTDSFRSKGKTKEEIDEAIPGYAAFARLVGRWKRRRG